MDTRDKGGVRALGTFFVLLVVALGVTFQVPEEGHGAVLVARIARRTPRFGGATRSA